MAEPPITRQAIHDDGPGNLMPTRVVIHSTEPNLGFPKSSAAGQAHSTALYFQMPSAGGSAHYIVDGSAEEHCVSDSHIAWHAPPNPRSLGIEICGQAVYTRAQWLSAEVWPAVALAARRTADLCQRYGIPVVKINSADLLNGAHGICGHADVSQAWRQTTHTDPGLNFPWAEFLAAVAGSNANVQTAVPPIRDGDKMEIDLRVKSDNTFRRLIQAEAGSSSVAVARAFVTFGAGWLAGNATAHFDVYALDASGAVMGPKAELHADVGNNKRDYLELPSGVVQVTISGTVPVGGEVSAALVSIPK